MKTEKLLTKYGEVYWWDNKIELYIFYNIHIVVYYLYLLWGIGSCNYRNWEVSWSAIYKLET